jgi:hypothetical protein
MTQGEDNGEVAAASATDTEPGAPGDGDPSASGQPDQLAQTDQAQNVQDNGTGNTAGATAAEPSK